MSGWGALHCVGRWGVSYCRLCYLYTGMQSGKDRAGTPRREGKGRGRHESIVGMTTVQLYGKFCNEGGTREVRHDRTERNLG